MITYCIVYQGLDRHQYKEVNYQPKTAQQINELHSSPYYYFNCRFIIIVKTRTEDFVQYNVQIMLKLIP